MQVSIQVAQQPFGRTARPVPAGPSATDVLDSLEQFGVTLRVARDKEIYREGANAEYCYRVVSGCVRTVTLMEDGRRQISEFLLPGDLFGLDELDTHAFAAEAVSDVVVRRYARRRVEAAAEGNAALTRHLRELTLARLRAAHQRLVLLGRKTATERLASFVLEQDRRTAAASGALLLLPMNRTDIADHLGLTVETVCRVLAHLKREGTVSISRGGLQLHDRIALRDLACETRH
jgi:CRP/FNR family nitrogen fixation transcriptional regulator